MAELYSWSTTTGEPYLPPCLISCLAALPIRYPHEKYTLGFAGRGGTGAFYISVVNNTMAHGPGTDRGGKDPEADTVFGRILPDSNGIEIVQQMRKQPGGVKPNGFINDQTSFILIEQLRLLSQREVRAVREMFSIEEGLSCQEVEERWARVSDRRGEQEEEMKRVWTHVRLETILPPYCSPYLTASPHRRMR